MPETSGRSLSPEQGSSDARSHSPEPTSEAVLSEREAPPDRFDKCADCQHYRSEHSPLPDPVCGCDVLGPFAEWHVCPCPAFVETA